MSNEVLFWCLTIQATIHFVGAMLLLKYATNQVMKMIIRVGFNPVDINGKSESQKFNDMLQRERDDKK